MLLKLLSKYSYSLLSLRPHCLRTNFLLKQMDTPTLYPYVDNTICYIILWLVKVYNILYLHVHRGNVVVTQSHGVYHVTSKGI